VSAIDRNQGLGKKLDCKFDLLGADREWWDQPDGIGPNGIDDQPRRQGSLRHPGSNARFEDRRQEKATAADMANTFDFSEPGAELLGSRPAVGQEISILDLGDHGQSRRTHHRAAAKGCAVIAGSE
jgi:hypothetical protein